MKDPHVHVEKSAVDLMGNAEMRDLIARATGLACDLPRTVGTGCSRRRPYAMTSKDPAKVTCLGCREYAARVYGEHEESARLLLGFLLEDASQFGPDRRVSPGQLRDQAEDYGRLAASFREAP
jgi:hypothetical protein